MVGRNPFLGVGLDASSSGRTVSVWLVASGIDLFNWSPGGLAPLLLWEVGSDPNVVEEVAYTENGSGEEEVQEDAVSSQYGRAHIGREMTYI